MHDMLHPFIPSFVQLTSPALRPVSNASRYSSATFVIGRPKLSLGSNGCGGRYEVTRELLVKYLTRFVVGSSPLENASIGHTWSLNTRPNASPVNGSFIGAPSRQPPLHAKSVAARFADSINSTVALIIAFNSALDKSWLQLVHPACSPLGGVNDALPSHMFLVPVTSVLPTYPAGHACCCVAVCGGSAHAAPYPCVKQVESASPAPQLLGEKVWALTLMPIKANPIANIASLIRLPTFTSSLFQLVRESFNFSLSHCLRISSLSLLLIAHLGDWDLF